MDRGILVLNSGSSSLKFASTVRLVTRFPLSGKGEIEKLMTSPKFSGRRTDGGQEEGHTWTGRSARKRGFCFVLDWVGKTFGDTRILAARAVV
jgi:hypothetical protein